MNDFFLKVKADMVMIKLVSFRNNENVCKLYYLIDVALKFDWNNN